MCCLLVPLMCDGKVWLRGTTDAPILYYCRTNTSPITRNGYRPDLLLQPTVWHRGWGRYTACIGQLCVRSGSTAGQQRGTETQTSHTPRQRWTWPRHRWGSGCQCDSSDPPGRSFTGSSLHISVYQHVSSLGQMCTTCTWKHTRKTVSKRDKKQKTKQKSQDSCDWGTEK